jgi:hypothetical protein
VEEFNSDDGDPLDRTIADYVSRRLDPQFGRALTTFRNSNDRSVRRLGSTSDRRWFVAIGTIAAVALAIVVWTRNQRDAVPHVAVDSGPLTVAGVTAPRDDVALPGPEGVQVERVSVTARAEPRVVEELIRLRTLDEGIVLIDGRRPVRKLRRQWLQRVAWFDANTGARLERIVPREELVYVDIPVN